MNMSAQRQKDLANDRADYKTCALYGRTERKVSGSTKLMRLFSRFGIERQISRVAQDVGKEDTENERMSQNMCGPGDGSNTGGRRKVAAVGWMHLLFPCPIPSINKTVVLT